MIRGMETGIENDYIIRILSSLLDEEPVYGAFIDDELVGFASYGVYGNSFAILGRLRTAIPYRGLGIARQLLSHLIQIIKTNDKIEWVGLTTLDENIPVHRIAGKLGMDHISSYYSCIMAHNQSIGGKIEQHWKEIVSLKEKSKIISQWFPSIEENTLKMFPYACYYPIKHDLRVLDDNYLNQCLMYRLDEKQRFIMAMRDEKRVPYFHIKYFWDDLYLHKEILQRLIRQSKEENRLLWIDLSEAGYKNWENHNLFSSVEKWKLYGQNLVNLLPN